MIDLDIVAIGKNQKHCFEKNLTIAEWKHILFEKVVFHKHEVYAGTPPRTVYRKKCTL